MRTVNATEYIAPKAKEITIHVEEIVCTSLTGSTNNEGYSEEIYEW